MPQVLPKVLYKKAVFRNFAKFTEKHLYLDFFFDKVDLKRLYENFIKKRDSNASVFLWILQNFLELIFNRTPPGDCFCPSWQIDFKNGVIKSYEAIKELHDVLAKKVLNLDMYHISN